MCSEMMRQDAKQKIPFRWKEKSLHWSGQWWTSLNRKEALKIQKCSLVERMTRVRGSSNNQRVLLANYVLGMEIGMLVHDLLYRHTGVDLGGRRRVKGKEKLGSWEGGLDKSVGWKGKEKLNRLFKKGEINSRKEKRGKKW